MRLQNLPLPIYLLTAQAPSLEKPPQKLLPTRKINRVLHWTEICCNQIQKVISIEKIADLGTLVTSPLAFHFVSNLQPQRLLLFPDPHYWVKTRKGLKPAYNICQFRLWFCLLFKCYSFLLYIFSGKHSTRQNLDLRPILYLEMFQSWELSDKKFSFNEGLVSNKMVMYLYFIKQLTKLSWKMNIEMTSFNCELKCLTVKIQLHDI